MDNVNAFIKPKLNQIAPMDIAALKYAARKYFQVAAQEAAACFASLRKAVAISLPKLEFVSAHACIELGNA